MKDLDKVPPDMEDTLSDLLEFAANNDVFAFKRSVELNLSAVDKAGCWYVRKKGSKQIIQEERTPLMIAATYGSVDVLKLLVALPEVDLNKSCGQDKWTALHCAAFGGSVNAFEAIRLLLSAGADPKIEDISGWLPVDVLVVPPILPGTKATIYDLLMGNMSDESVGEYNLRVSMCSSNVSSPRLSSSPEIGMLHSASNLVYSPRHPNFGDTAVNSVSDKKQYPVDSSLPDIRDGIFSTDEFRMYSFKIKPCSRAYSHDWTECPFAHPGENARRRDPRKYHYSCVPCPDFRKGACKRADMCEYAHGVFECWLHPAQYRTRMCKDGTSCARQVCFFAHTEEELRPLYASTGSGVPSPRSAASSVTFMDMAAALNHLSGSPTSQPLMSPVFSQAMSPTANGMSHSTTGWPQPSVPTLNLPGTNLKSSRLRSSFSARDVPPEDLNVLQDFDIRQPDFTNLAHFSQPRPNSAMLSCSGRSKTMLTPSNLEELFSAEIHSSSPRFSDQAAAFGAFSPSHKAAVLNQFQQRPGILSLNSSNSFSPKNVEHPLLHSAFDPSSSPRMSQGSLEPGSPMSARLSAFVQRERQQQLRSLGSRDLGSNNSPILGSPATAAWSKWGSPNRKADWSITRDDQACLKRSCSLDVKSKAEEPNSAWKEPSSGIMDNRAAFISAAAVDVPSGEFLKPDSQIDPNDHSVLGDWLEQMRLDQLTV